MRRILGGIFAAILLLTTACGSVHHAAVVAAKPTSSPVRCGAAYSSWRTVASTDLLDLTSAINNVHLGISQVGADARAARVPGADGTALAASLGAMIGVSERMKTKDMPPRCIPNLDKDYSVITGNLMNAGVAYMLFLGAANQKNVTRAASALTVANGYLATANNGFKSAQADLASFTSGA
jgi:hypothetical protein